MRIALQRKHLRKIHECDGVCPEQPTCSFAVLLLIFMEDDDVRMDKQP